MPALPQHTTLAYHNIEVYAEYSTVVGFFAVKPEPQANSAVTLPLHAPNVTGIN